MHAQLCPSLMGELLCRHDVPRPSTGYIPVHALLVCTCTVVGWRILITIPSQKSAHGRCTLYWAKMGGWADIRGINIAFIRKRVTHASFIIWIVAVGTIDFSLIQARLPIQSKIGCATSPMLHRVSLSAAVLSGRGNDHYLCTIIDLCLNMA